MSQLSKVAKHLRRNTEGAGISVRKLAHLARIPREDVSKRIYDLREEGKTIYTNSRIVRGKRTTFYRLAA